MPASASPASAVAALVRGSLDTSRGIAAAGECSDVPRGPLPEPIGHARRWSGSPNVAARTRRHRVQPAGRTRPGPRIGGAATGSQVAGLQGVGRTTGHTCGTAILARYWPCRLPSTNRAARRRPANSRCHRPPVGGAMRRAARGTRFDNLGRHGNQRCRAALPEGAPAGRRAMRRYHRHGSRLRPARGSRLPLTPLGSLLESQREFDGLALRLRRRFARVQASRWVVVQGHRATRRPLGNQTGCVFATSQRSAAG